MPSARPRRTRAALALLLAALVALPPALAVATSPSTAGSTAHAAKAKPTCPRKGHKGARKRNCRKSGPPANTPFFNEDRSLRIVATGGKHRKVNVRWSDLVITCPGGGIAHTLFVTSAPLSGTTFQSSVPSDDNGGVKFVKGRFSGKTVTGEARVSFTIPGQGVCDSGKLSFTATSR